SMQQYSYQEIGNLIKQERKALGDSQEVFAIRCEVGMATIYRIEKGQRINVLTLEKILKVIGYKIITTSFFVEKIRQ
ncbi:MAG: helix-turn-helix domain-containing protein, partial [Chitinophagales bacterium]